MDGDGRYYRFRRRKRKLETNQKTETQMPQTITGVLRQGKGRFFIEPDLNWVKKVPLVKKGLGGAQSGQRVLALLSPGKQSKKSFQGKVIRILPDLDEPGAMVFNLIIRYQIPYEFDAKVEKQAGSMPQTVGERGRKGRRDLRKLFMVTIDGADAKDLDDAVSLERLENGQYRLGVHIADVAHYVQEKTPLDEEAFRRGTSVYLADRVIPMLPPSLSNGICSLNEGEDRLALSCIMDIGDDGEVSAYEIVETVIRVDHRMTYQAVNGILTGEDENLTEKYRDHLPFFQDLERLRRILLEKRLKRGAMVFELAETKIIVDEQGRAVDIVREERNLATGIIEEAMLVCNETVAEDCFRRRLPVVFRVHEKPDPEKLRQLSGFVKRYGYALRANASSKSIQALLDKLEGGADASAVNKAVLRSMQQARYESKNLGHYGLAARYYCHFTSPIRRYPDLQVHRIIKEAMKTPLGEGRLVALQEKMPPVSAQSSFTERRAVDLERAVADNKKAEYMANKIGWEFQGVISSVVPWGLYVELENTVEGLVPVRTMTDDAYVPDESKSALVGAESKRAYRLGDAVTVRLTKADAISGNIDFVLVKA